MVEGYSRRRYKADFIKFLIYSQPECDETIVHLERINKFIQWVEDNLNDFNKRETGNQEPELFYETLVKN
ncbi:MAG TPA: four helix bundle protein [Chitinophagaceae bacterium]